MADEVVRGASETRGPQSAGTPSADDDERRSEALRRVTRESSPEDARTRRREWIVAGLATVYTLFLIYVAGAKFLLFSCILYAPGLVLYVIARRENKQRLFSPAELGLCSLLMLGAFAGVVGLASGSITI